MQEHISTSHVYSIIDTRIITKPTTSIQAAIQILDVSKSRYLESASLTVYDETEIIRCTIHDRFLNAEGVSLEVIASDNKTSAYICFNNKMHILRSENYNVINTIKSDVSKIENYLMPILIKAAGGQQI
ncbi:hypothetical protein [Brucella gallinifaecis]|uniref:hypothetical protein n=1 Tax=Brucella gallinifaecis TaxID=215590 RepID=UPI00235E9745|nr:hypothetical protein [Brucella gallinifaecis]